MPGGRRDVLYSPKSGHSSPRVACPLSAISRHPLSHDRTPQGVAKPCHLSAIYFEMPEQCLRLPHSPSSLCSSPILAREDRGKAHSRGKHWPSSISDPPSRLMPGLLSFGGNSKGRETHHTNGIAGRAGQPIPTRRSPHLDSTRLRFLRLWQD